MKNKIIFLCLTAFCLSVNAAEFSINADTKISEIHTSLGTPIRSLTKENKKAEFTAPDKYTFFDLYTKTFGVVVMGVKPTTFRLSKKIDTKSNAQLLSIHPVNPDLPDVSVLGIKLGMNFNDAKKKMADIDISTPEKSGKIEYALPEGAKVKISSSSKKVTDVELFLK